MAEQSQNFEEILTRLDTLVRGLESGTLSLEASLDSFQKGVALVKQCQELLGQAEQKVSVLLKATAEGIETKPITEG